MSLEASKCNHFPVSSPESEHPPGAMDALSARLDEMMRILAEERAQQLATEENLRQTQARLNAAVGQQNQHPAHPKISPAPPPTSSPNSMVLAKPQPFNGTRGAAAESFVGQILLHTITYPEQFSTNTRIVALAVLLWNFSGREKELGREIDNYN
ncbi:uncharacterized protein VP01_9172g1 [Puccinia sorghi]|uniref:Uncharacterized protein n=1 Tax=Puccinia sorghi TaxID=27349 RepID=A0A0L6U9J3_9BASI|nr:uncharacterized protein VP01_9172g1 [Puccinia sorghi]